jgi:hypothetical protein
VKAGRIIGWWELRRIPYNIIIGIFGCLALLIFFLSLCGSGHLEEGEDAVEPVMLFFAPIAANICYTGGWLVDLLIRLVRPSLNPTLTPLMFGAGLALSLAVISIPAVVWGFHFLLHLVHVVG